MRVKQHGAEQEWKVKNARSYEIAGKKAVVFRRGVADDSGEVNCDVEIAKREQRCHDGIRHSSDAKESGPQGDGNHENGIKKSLNSGRAGGPGDRLLGGGKADATVPVVIAIEPADGHEVGKLPDEEHGEEGDSGPLDDAAGSRPADQWRECAGEGANKGVQRSNPL